MSETTQRLQTRIAQSRRTHPRATFTQMSIADVESLIVDYEDALACLHQAELAAVELAESLDAATA